jgi:hypothetical protein
MIPYYFSLVRHPQWVNWVQLVYSSDALQHDPTKSELVHISLDNALEKYDNSAVCIFPDSKSNNSHNVFMRIVNERPLTNGELAKMHEDLDIVVGDLFEFLTKKGWQYTTFRSILEGQKELIFG